MRIAKQIALLGLGLLSACYATAPAEPESAKAKQSAQGAHEGGIYQVMDASGRAFVPLGAAHRSPERRGSPTVIAQGVALEFADERALTEELPFTIVDNRGTCVTRAKSRLLIGRRERDAAEWLEALELEGCAGDPGLPRLALAGSTSAARWITPQEAVFIDGELMQGSQFLDREVDGKKVLRQYHFPGTNLVLETEYVAPHKGAAKLKLIRAKHELASYPAASVAGAVGIEERLLIVLDGAGLTVVEIVGDEAVTLLSPSGEARVH